MKFLHTLFIFLCLPFLCNGQTNLIKLATTNIHGSSISLITIPSNDAQTTISIDWGNGTAVDATLTGRNAFKKISGNVLGDTIRIYTPLSKFDCADNNVTYLQCKMPSLKNLICGQNQFTHYNFDITEALNLEHLDVHLNRAIQFLNLIKHTKLKSLQAYNWKDERGLITTILLPTSNCLIENLNIYGNDISHLDVTHCPKLTSLNAGYNSLMDIDVTRNIAIQYLTLSNNMISEIDISKNNLMEQFYCSNNYLSNINLYFNPKLVKIGVANNKLTELKLYNFKSLTDLSCNDNQIKSLDLSSIPLLYRFNCANNLLDALDLRNNPILKKLYCDDNNLTSLNLIGNSNITYISIMNNAKMTPQGLNYMFSHLMTGLEGDSPYTNLLIKGSNAEHANTDLAKAVRFSPDVEGDATAPHIVSTITRVPATNGSYKLQIPTSFDTNVVTWEHDTIAVGTPIYIKATPKDGYRVESILVNGKEISTTLCAATTDAISIEVRFTLNPENVYFTLTSPLSTQLEFTVRNAQDSKISVDWGDGNLIPVDIIGGKRSFLKGKVKGTVKVTGYTDFVDVANNEITTIDFTHNPLLISINTYWSGITDLDLSNQVDLEYLDCSFNEIKTLDISNNPKLKVLISYSCGLSTLDISAQTQLTELFAKGNTFDHIDLSKNKKLRIVNLHNCGLTQLNVNDLDSLRQFQCSLNKLTTIDLSKNTKLTHFVGSSNKLTSLDLQNCPDLEVLHCSKNQLSTFDLSKNTKLQRLFCEESGLTNLDLHNNIALNYLNLGGNELTACQLNALYYNLPYNVNPPEGFNFYNAGSTKTNLYAGAESQIGARKNWSLSGTGDGSACETAYITIVQPANGTVQVLDAKNNVINSGDAVTKNQEIKLITTPNENYKLNKAFQNNVKIVNNIFNLQMSTTIEVDFTNNTALNDASINAQIWSKQSHLFIASEEATTVTVFTLDGICVYSQTVRGEASIELAQGIYLVQLKQQGQTMLHKVKL